MMNDSNVEGERFPALASDGQEQSPHAPALPEPQEPPGDEEEAGPLESEFLHTFLAGGYNYVIPAGTPAILLRLGEIRHLPFSPIWFEGLAHHRGDLVPVFDLPPYLQPGTARGKGRYLLIVGAHEQKVGLRVEQVTAFPLGRTQPLEGPAEEGVVAPFVLRRFRLDDMPYLELNLFPLFEQMIQRGVAAHASAAE